MSDPVYKRMSGPERSRVIEFLRANFAPDGVQNRADWLRWHERNPRGTHLQLCVVEDEVAAFSVFMPVNICLEGEVHSGAVATDLMVTANHRRKGLGAGLHRERLSAYDFALSVGQSRANFHLYEKLGFHKLAHYRELLLVPVFPRFYPRKRYLRELFSWLSWKLRPRGRETFELELGEELREVPADILVRRFDARCVFPVVDGSYLRWRFLEHPHWRYRFAYLGRGGETLALAVLRDKGRGELSLVDLYCEQENLETALLTLGAKLRCRKVTGLFCGRFLEETLNAIRWYHHPHGTYFIGSSNDTRLVENGVNKSWCFFMGEADKEPIQE